MTGGARTSERSRGGGSVGGESRLLREKTSEQNEDQRLLILLSLIKEERETHFDLRSRTLIVPSRVPIHPPLTPLHGLRWLDGSVAVVGGEEDGSRSRHVAADTGNGDVSACRGDGGKWTGGPGLRLNGGRKAGEGCVEVGHRMAGGDGVVPLSCRGGEGGTLRRWELVARGSRLEIHGGWIVVAS